MASEDLNFRDPKYWDEVWEAVPDDSPHGGGTTLLLKVLGELLPGRALDMGCGTGRNAVLMAQRGWRVTAVDFSQMALESGRRKATEANAAVEFVLSDAAGYVPEGAFDLITSFYIQLPPEVRAALLATLCDALAPGGKLLFVSHDRSTPPPGWSKTDKLTLTTVETVVSELHGVEIEFASVLEPGEMAGNHENRHDENRHDENRHDDHKQRLDSTVILARAGLPRQ